MNNVLYVVSISSGSLPVDTMVFDNKPQVEAAAEYFKLYYDEECYIIDIEIREIMELLDNQKRIEKQMIEIRKGNINKSYYLAKHDFRVIENMEDVYETLDYIIDKLKDCQERIIERNSINISDL